MLPKSVSTFANTNTEARFGNATESVTSVASFDWYAVLFLKLDSAEILVVQKFSEQTAVSVLFCSVPKIDFKKVLISLVSPTQFFFDYQKVDFELFCYILVAEIFVFEDVIWIDPVFLKLLRYLRQIGVVQRSLVCKFFSFPWDSARVSIST